MNRVKQQGFTLIELVMVIVILGILAATALPKFADLKKDARIASIHGVTGAMNSAVAIAHSASQLKATNSTSITLEGSTVTMLNGYPTADAAGMLLALSLSANDYIVAYTTTAPATMTVSLSDKASTPSAVASCNVVYTAAGAGGAPTVVETTSGC